MSDKTDYHRGYTPELPSAGAGAGTVTSVALNMPAQFTVTGSPVTAAGTLNASWVSQTQRLFFASPNSGSGTPGFRAILATDLPDLSSQYQPRSSTLDDLALGSPNVSFSNTSLFRRTYVLPNIDATILTDANPVTVPQGGTGLTSLTTGNYLRAASPTTLQQRTPAQVRADIGAGTGNGTVTSVALSPPTDMSVTGSPITGAGTLNLTWNNQLANRFLASPISSTGAPAFRAIAVQDLPVLGSNTQIPFNDNGSWGVSPEFSFDVSSNLLRVGLWEVGSGDFSPSDQWASQVLVGSSGSISIDCTISTSLIEYQVVVGGVRFAIDSSGGLSFNYGKIYHEGNVGAGSGLDSDLLDGQHGTYYLTWTNMSGVNPLSKGGTGASTATAARTNLGLGTAATRDVPASGNATSLQVVLGNDTRLSTPGSNTQVIYNQSGTLVGSVNMTFDGVLFKASEAQARLAEQVFNANTTLSSSTVPNTNRVIKKTGTGNYTYTLSTSLGANGDTLTFVNAASAGNITLQGSGVTLYVNGAVASTFVIGPRKIHTFYRVASNQWIG